MMKAAQRATLSVLGALAVTASLASASQAQRGQTEPPPMAPSFTPLETRVETQGERTTITFANRSYRIEPLRNPRSPERGPQVMLHGEGAWPNFEGTGYDRGRFATYYGRSGPNAFWLLPGFGLVAVYDYVDPRSGSRILRRDLVRGQDGTIEPFVPGRTPFWEPHFVARSGGQMNDLTAERTLFISGSLTAFRSSGAGVSMTLQPLESTLSFAWMFDEAGLIQQWSPLVDISGNSASTSAATNALVYQRQSDQGHVTFATQGEAGTLNVHLVAPDLRTITTHTGVLRLKLRREDPARIATTVSAIGEITRESREQNLDDNTTLLLAPLQDFEGWYGILEADGSISVPGGGRGLMPLTRTISSGAFYEGMVPVNY
ncbi:MAG: hypothetical protein ACQRW7_11720, partial [Caulobacterales bacterium]|uniref:hypothetical protein n=1 Tax=Glycocaulis sp. TaxID=1969725 RepID=UPI003F9FD950